MRQVPTYLLIGNGRVSRHFQHYFTHLGLTFSVWQRADGVEQLPAKLTHATHVLLLINDGAIEEFIAKTLDPAIKLGSDIIKIHFSGSLVTNLAYGAHPLMTFSHDLYNIEQYRTLPFVLDDDALDFSQLLPGLPNPHSRLAKKLKAKYHALCVLSGNFSCILWNKLFDDFESELNLPPSIAHPYLQQQMQNLLTNPKQALTGPLVRGDEATLVKNMEALAGDAYQDIFRSFVLNYKCKENLTHRKI